MSEFLSQEDIDALLQGGLGDDTGDSDSSDALGSANFIDELGKDLGEQIKSVLSMLTGKEININVGESFIGDETMISSHLGEGEYLSGEMPISGDINGGAFITIQIH